MTSQPPSRNADYFTALYEANPDPWNFTTSAYEHRKYDATLAALGGRHFGRIFEVGCSIGVLTSRLAARGDALLAIDIAETALAAAKRRCAGLPHVCFANRRVPEQWPTEQTFDLIIFSEMLYFLAPADIAALAANATASLHPQGIILLVNYTGEIDEPCSGDEAADLFIAAARPALASPGPQRQETFRIDLLARNSF